ncbi:type II secretion system F family protein [Nocardia asteroides]|uniref:type II secretion system F family protein n=1 Tax=Nocardia asteroides TaxID=1824 RepID=UPI001E5BC36F|nr:type II secretion system F family protein [Nocardia asteroides]UGT59546.1 type II secretion system F family protein [Nocardia asteroides]
MSAAFACLAVALLLVPPPAARRRLSSLGIGGSMAGSGGVVGISGSPTGSGGVVGISGSPTGVDGRGRVIGGRHQGRLRIILADHRAEAVCFLATAAAALLGVGASIATGVLACTVLLRIRRSRIDRTRETGSADLLDALELVVAELRVGAHPGAAAESAATDACGEAAAAFAVAAGRSKLGGSAADGLERPTSPIAPELARIATAWRIAEEHGLALAELITAARTDLHARQRFRSRTTAALAGARATATVLAALPILGIALGHLMGAAPLDVLLGPGAGTILLPLGATFACAGLLWTDAITRSVLP